MKKALGKVQLLDFKSSKVSIQDISSHRWQKLRTKVSRGLDQRIILDQTEAGPG